jgi:hypothetical protein
MLKPVRISPAEENATPDSKEAASRPPQFVRYAGRSNVAALAI